MFKKAYIKYWWKNSNLLTGFSLGTTLIFYLLLGPFIETLNLGDPEGGKEAVVGWAILNLFINLIAFIGLYIKYRKDFK